MNLQKIPPEYWAECLADEKELAPLMGWARLDMPTNPTPEVWILGSNHAEFASEVGPKVTSSGMFPMPRWRRDHRAIGGLIDKIKPNVQFFDDDVLVWMPGREVRERFRDHPTDGHAFRAALVKLAIQYLTHRRREAADRPQPNWSMP